MIKNYFKPSSKKGFTLIELMIVIAIIAVLVVILVTALNPVRLIGQARDSRRRSDLNQLKAALQLYYNDCKAYPTDAQVVFGNALGSSTGNGVDGVSGTCDDGVVYMKQVPNDTNGSYDYVYLNSGADYRVTANIDYPNSDDTNTLSKCGATSSGTVKFAVCND